MQMLSFRLSEQFEYFTVHVHKECTLWILAGFGKDTNLTGVKAIVDSIH